eukprot:6034589-Pleurochrysis_carterae.AAC.1
MRKRKIQVSGQGGVLESGIRCVKYQEPKASGQVRTLVRKLRERLSSDRLGQGTSMSATISTSERWAGAVNERQR